MAGDGCLNSRGDINEWAVLDLEDIGWRSSTRNNKISSGQRNPMEIRRRAAEED
jgi:hypothetical protein